MPVDLTIRVTISSGYQTGDRLDFNHNLGINGSFDANTGVLTLTSTNGQLFIPWRDVTRSITFGSTSAIGGLRAIKYEVIDNAQQITSPSNFDYVYIDPPLAPVVTASAGTTSISANAGASIIDNAVTITDGDSATLSSGTVTISANKQTGDVLTFTNNNAGTFGNISASYDANTGVLSLS